MKLSVQRIEISIPTCRWLVAGQMCSLRVRKGICNLSSYSLKLRNRSVFWVIFTFCCCSGLSFIVECTSPFSIMDPLLRGWYFLVLKPLPWSPDMQERWYFWRRLGMSSRAWGMQAEFCLEISRFFNWSVWDSAGEGEWERRWSSVVFSQIVLEEMRLIEVITQGNLHAMSWGHWNTLQRFFCWYSYNKTGVYLVDGTEQWPQIPICRTYVFWSWHS